MKIDSRPVAASSALETVVHIDSEGVIVSAQDVEYVASVLRTREWAFSDIPLEQCGHLEGIGVPVLQTKAPTLFDKPAYIFLSADPTSVLFRDATGNPVIQWTGLGLPQA